MVHSAIATGNYFNLHPQDKTLLCFASSLHCRKNDDCSFHDVGLELDIMVPTSHLDDLLSHKIYDFVAIVPLQAENSLEKITSI